MTVLDLGLAILGVAIVGGAVLGGLVARGRVLHRKRWAGSGLPGDADPATLDWR
jgi:hypothetical protein